MNQQALIEFYLAHQWLVLPVFIVLVIGVALLWFGGLVAALVALGNRQWLWGIPTIILGPFTGLPYALLYPGRAEYARTLMLRGLAMVLGALVLLLLIWLFA
ncbi:MULTISPECIES: hypothetical protein [Microbulbifer]|uniref:hypothetical protein n=1 Tax=Microbulbifer TaxID=48073 RepID=UPI001E5A5B8A|nr:MULTISPECIES: hypothetical protein [Microbulbifer]UHQ55237.1 hypothetical protein LVE68_17265 [Microbulbifer sp. YPW16]